MEVHAASRVELVIVLSPPNAELKHHSALRVKYGAKHNLNLIKLHSNGAPTLFFY